MPKRGPACHNKTYVEEEAAEWAGGCEWLLRCGWGVDPQVRKHPLACTERCQKVLLELAPFCKSAKFGANWQLYALHPRFLPLVELH